MGTVGGLHSGLELLVFVRDSIDGGADGGLDIRQLLVARSAALGSGVGMSDSDHRGQSDQRENVRRDRIFHVDDQSDGDYQHDNIGFGLALDGRSTVPR